MSIKNLPEHRLFWLWLPLLGMAGQLIAEYFFPMETMQHFHREGGLHEWLQFALLAGVFILSLRILFKMDRSANWWLTSWIALAVLGSFYTAGEEISWGQWVFNWQTPEEWAAINGQNETNLHNASRWLNQIPRYILQIGVLIGGIIIPALMMIKPSLVPHKFSIIYPPRQLFAIALILLFAVAGHKLAKEIFDAKLFARSSEVEELYVYYFLFLYLIALSSRIIGTRKIS